MNYNATMKTALTLFILFVVGVLLRNRLQAPPEPPCPSDRELIERFITRESDFAQLLADSENQELRASLGITQSFSRGTSPRLHFFQVWFQDFVGPGGCSKGYVFSETPIASMVKSIDANSNPGSPEIKELIHNINGGWHLYYSSDN